MAPWLLAIVPSMRVRLSRKLAEQIDGVDLRMHGVGDVIDLPPRDARLLLAEGWAIAERRERQLPHPVERRHSSSPAIRHAASDSTRVKKDG